jgi:hypothetical protein
MVTGAPEANTKVISDRVQIPLLHVADPTIELSQSR